MKTTKEADPLVSYVIENDEEEALRDTLEHQARDIQLSLRHGDHPGFFHLTKKNPLSEEEYRVSADWPLVELGEVIAKRAEASDAITPTCWRAKVMENSRARYEPDEHWVIVEILETDADAPPWAQYEANRYISTSHPGADVTYDPNSPPSKVSPPAREPDGTTSFGHRIWRGANP
jgi:hypothetical protein